METARLVKGDLPQVFFPGAQRKFPTNDSEKKNEKYLETNKNYEKEYLETNKKYEKYTWKQTKKISNKYLETNKNYEKEYLETNKKYEKKYLETNKNMKTNIWKQTKKYEKISGNKPTKIWKKSLVFQRGERSMHIHRGRPKFIRLPVELSQCLKKIASSPGTSAPGMMPLGRGFLQGKWMFF